MRHLAAFVVLALPSFARAQSVERVSLDGESVAVYNLAGTVRVEGGAGNQVVVEVRRAGRDAGRLTLETGRVRGRMALRVMYPGDRISYPDEGWSGRTTIRVAEDGTFDDDDGWNRGRRVEIEGRGDGLDAHADLRIIVPRGRRLELRHGVGETTVDNVEGALDLNVNARRVKVSRVRGSVSVEAGSGGVDLSDVTGDVKIESGSGGMTIAGVRGGSLHLEAGSGGVRGESIDVSELGAEVGSGGIRLRGVSSKKVRLESGSGGGELELLTAVSDISVETGSGGVTLRLPANTAAAVDIDAGSGSITSDFDIVTRAHLERHALRGTIGSGEGRIRIETGSGSVKLLKR